MHSLFLVFISCLVVAEAGATSLGVTNDAFQGLFLLTAITLMAVVITAIGIFFYL